MPVSTLSIVSCRIVIVDCFDDGACLALLHSTLLHSTLVERRIETRSLTLTCCGFVVPFAKVYHSTFIGQESALSCGAALLPLKTKVKGPAPPAKTSQNTQTHRHTLVNDIILASNQRNRERGTNGNKETGGRKRKALNHIAHSKSSCFASFVENLNLTTDGSSTVLHHQSNNSLLFHYP